MLRKTQKQNPGAIAPNKWLMGTEKRNNRNSKLETRNLKSELSKPKIKIQQPQKILYNNCHICKQIQLYMINLKASIRSIPNFPQQGINFRDITTLMHNAQAFNQANNQLFEHYKNMQINKVLGIDARGFIFGAVLAQNLNVGFVPIRKKGKLPYKTISVKYELEYGNSELELHTDALIPGERVIIVDDLIATGGTVAAAINLVEQLGAVVVECACVVELPDLKGRKSIGNYKVFSLIEFEGE